MTPLALILPLIVPQSEPLTVGNYIAQAAVCWVLLAVLMNMRSLDQFSHSEGWMKRADEAREVLAVMNMERREA